VGPSNRTVIIGPRKSCPPLLLENAATLSALVALALNGWLVLTAGKDGEEFGGVHRSLHHEPQLGGVLALAAVIEERLEALAQILWRGRRTTLQQRLPDVLAGHADLLQT
jgi:hypothetical protein